MGFLSFLTDPIDKILAPIGIRPFTPSGPGGYPDRGLGDSSLAASRPLQAAGQNFLNLSQGQAGANDPYANLFNQIAGESGVNSPFGGGTGGTPHTVTSAGANGKSGNQPETPAVPGELTGSYLDSYNNLAGHVQKARNSALSDLKAHMAARGLADSSEARAHEDYLNSQFDNHLADTMTQLQGQQHQERLSTLGNFINSLQGFGGLGANMINGNVNNLNTNANAAEKRTNAANSQLGGFASMFTPGGLFGSGAGGAGTSVNDGGNGSGGGAMFGPPDSMANFGGNSNPYMMNPWWNPVSANN